MISYKRARNCGKPSIYDIAAQVSDRHKQRRREKEREKQRDIKRKKGKKEIKIYNYKSKIVWRSSVLQKAMLSNFYFKTKCISQRWCWCSNSQWNSTEAITQRTASLIIKTLSCSLTHLEQGFCVAYFHRLKLKISVAFVYNGKSSC